MKTAFEYVRISDEDQSRFSISGQGLINQEYALRNNIKIVKSFVDDGYSAKDFNRPAWRELEAELTKNKVDYLIVWKYDRLIRNAVEGLVFVEKLEKKLNITLLSVMENYAIDPQDPYFFKQRADIFIDADFERRRISDRTRMGQWSGKSQGRYLGPAPYGYVNSRDDQDKPIILIDPDKKKIIQDIFDDFLSGQPLSVVAKRAAKNGFNMGANEAVKRILSKEVYGGLITVPAYKSEKKKIIKGIHEAIVPEDVYWRAYYKLKEQLRPQLHNPLNENLPLRGFLFCEHCGNAHTGTKCKGKRSHYYYYWCGHCRGKNFSAIKVDDHMTEMLQGLSLTQSFVDILKIESEIELEQSQKDRTIKLEKVTRDQAEAQKKLLSLEEKFINDQVNQSTYDNWYSTYRSELHRAEISIARLTKNNDDLYRLFNTHFQYLTDLNWVYKKAPIEDKQMYLKEIFPGCLTTKLQGYRTPYLPKAISLNASKIGHLLEVKNERELSFSNNSPSWVQNENEIEHFLRVIAHIVKAA